MSLRLLKASIEIENQDDFHLPRLLILLAEADKRSSGTIEGITKLAKLDFLLRYPNCLERALIFLTKHSSKLNIREFERTNIESKMIRYRYGPWDRRYRRWIGILVSKDLAVTYKQGRTVHLGLTDRGRKVAESLNSLNEFVDMRNRSKLIFSAVGSKGATSLKDLIYDIFPEIISMKWGEDIEL